MATVIHICADRDWGGAETRALICARSSSGIVICTDTPRVVRRMEASGVEVLRCSFSGVFASVSLSRVLRHLPAGECQLMVHSPAVRRLVAEAVKLAGRKDVILLPEVADPVIPAREVALAAPGDELLLLWIGRITPDCGLVSLIEALGRLPERQWRLRVVGEGEAGTVMPIVKRGRSLDIASRIEWIGYVDDIYQQMQGATLGVITRREPLARTVYREFAAASLPVICGTDSETLFNALSSIL